MVAWIGLGISVLLNIAGWVYTYGRLSERVDSLQYDVRELRSTIMARAAGR